MKSFNWKYLNEILEGKSFKSGSIKEIFWMKISKRKLLNEILEMKSFQWNVLSEIL